jgi:hypothetical protein
VRNIQHMQPGNDPGLADPLEPLEELFRDLRAFVQELQAERAVEALAATTG